ncbi:MAG: glycosyltransferase family 2 protein [Sediminibacterium sp.]
MGDIDSKLPKISVVTVCYNAELFIEDTIRSVINQTYENIQYIVIDGQSKDQTMSIIQGYKNHINVLLSEPDGGIYDAMNKALDYVSGTWVIYLNAGDTFHHSNTIFDIFNAGYDTSNVHFIYGDTIGMENKIEKAVLKPLDLKHFWKRIPICHQSCFIRTDIQRSNYYSLNYKVSSVYDFFYKCYLQGFSFKYIPVTISKYDLNGYSSLSLLWLWDYTRISLNYSKGKRLKVLVKICSYFVVRSFIYLKRKLL